MTIQLIRNLRVQLYTCDSNETFDIRWQLFVLKSLFLP